MEYDVIVRVGQQENQVVDGAATASGSQIGCRTITDQPINPYFVTRTKLRRANELCSLTIAWNSCEEDDVVILSFIKLFLQNGKSLEKIEIMHKAVVELHNVDLPKYTVFIDDRGMIEASFEATMHPPVNKYNPQLKPLRIDTGPIAHSEIISRVNAAEHENNRDQVATEVGATANGSQPKRRKITDWKDDELFSSGQAIRPRNPYFVTRPNLKRKYELNNRDQVATEVGATANGSQPKRRKITDWKDDELFSSGQAIRPRNPYFVTRPNLKRKYELHVPRAVVRLHNLNLNLNLNLPMNIVYIDEQGRKFPAKRKQCKDGRIVYTKGWKNLCSLNLLGEEDKIICEFICIQVLSVPIRTNDRVRETICKFH